MYAIRPRFVRFTAVAISSSILTLWPMQAVMLASAQTILGTRADTIASSVSGAVTSHVFSLTMLNTTNVVGSIGFEFCSNTPIPNTGCTFPAGFSAANRVLSAQTGDGGFSIHANSNSNRIVLSRPPLNPTAVLSTYQFDNIVNPSSPGSYYVRLQTYTSTDGTGPDIENGGVVFAIVSSLSLSAVVPPYLKLCVAVTIVSFDCSTANSFFIDMGELSRSTTSKGSSQFVVATNAASGYSVTLSGTTLTAGNNTISALTVPTGSIAGTSQFGLNLRANSNPVVGNEVVGPGGANTGAGYSTPNQYKFQSGDTLVSSSNSDDNRKFTVSYVANINANQPAGVYVTTLTYICLANF